MSAIVLKIRIYGDACLRKKCKPVAAVGPSERMLIQAMIDTMHANKGVGLAAPQVGINEQIFVVDTGDDPFAVINPKIIRRIGSDELEEGCLSIPGVHVKVKRAKTILVKYTDELNREVERSMTDLMAKVFQHETDHLNGKLIVDYAGVSDKLKIRKKLKDLQEGHIPADDSVASGRSI